MTQFSVDMTELAYNCNYSVVLQSRHTFRLLVLCN